MYKQVGKQRALVTGLGILMKNSNNIKWGVSTADTLLLRALQTDRVTRYTHYAATVQPLSVMMMAALTGAQLLKLLSCKHSPPMGGKKNRVALSRHVFPVSSDLPVGERHRSPGVSATPFPSRPPSLLFADRLHLGSQPWKMQIKISALKDCNCPPCAAQSGNGSWQASFRAQASGSVIHRWALVSRGRKKKTAHKMWASHTIKENEEVSLPCSLHFLTI